MKIYRNILNDIEKWLGKPKILILKGARQVGKTTILKYLAHKLETENKTVKYFFVDRELGNPLFNDANLLIRFIKDQYNGKFLLLFALYLLMSLLITNRSMNLIKFLILIN